jgi:hypothetical protein
MGAGSFGALAFGQYGVDPDSLVPVAMTDRLSLDAPTMQGGTLGSVTVVGAQLQDATVQGGTIGSISIRMDP